MKFNFWGNEIELSEDCKKYFDIYYKYMSEAEQLKKTLIDIRNNTNKTNWREKLENLNFVIEYCISQRIKLIIQEMSQNDIYDRDIKDYYNRGYYGCQNEIEKFYSFMKKTHSEQADEITRKTQEAYRRERAKITGNSYGILTNSYSSALAYSISDILTLHSQREEAKLNYERSRQGIVNSAIKTFEKECENYFRFTLIKNLLQEIDIFYKILFDQYINELNSLGKIKPIYFNISQAEKLLSNFETKLNKKDIICIAINEFPLSILEDKEIIYYIFREGAGDELLKLIEFTSYNANVSDMIEKDIFSDLKIEKFRKLIEENRYKIEYLSKIKNEDKEEIIKQYSQIVYESISKSDTYHIDRLENSDDTINFVCEKLNKDKINFVEKPIRKMLEKNYEEMKDGLSDMAGMTNKQIFILILMNIFFFIFLFEDIIFLATILWISSIGYSANLLYENYKTYKEFENNEKNISLNNQLVKRYINKILKDNKKQELEEFRQELETKYLKEKNKRKTGYIVRKCIVAIIGASNIFLILYGMSRMGSN